MPYAAKAIYAAVIAFLGTLATALLPVEGQAENVVTASEWVSITLTTVLAAGGTYQIENGTRARGDRGAISGGLILTVVVVVLAIIGLLALLGRA